MPQTLGAFLALSTVMLFSFNYQQASFRSSMSAVNSEMEVMANAVAAEAMQYVATKSFDARTFDKTVTEFNAVAALLTAPASFGDGGLFANALDIDDFNNMQSDTVWFAMTDTEGFNFTVDAKVRYIDSMGNETLTPTWIKEVTISVSGPDYNNRKLLYHPIVLTRQFSPMWY